LSDYLVAERIGTRQAWETFLALHASGIYADLARAQLAKLGGGIGESRGQPDTPPAPKQPGEFASKERDCKRDSERLAQMRSNPILDEVVRFSRELTCDGLRPQLARLLESVGAKDIPIIGSTASPQPAPAPSERSLPPAATKEQVCKRESEALARLRANPTLQEVTRFSRELTCDGLRPQLARLLESVGTKDVPIFGSTASPQPAPAPSEQGLPPAATKAQICKRESEALARLRANPTLQEVTRFSRELGCDELRPQVARLLESVGGADVAAVAPTPVLPQAPTQAKAEQSPQTPMPKAGVCKRDADLLARLRANPTLQDAKRFSRDLACERLRTQASRLLESLGG
jgi:hypothetical protein